VTVDGTLMDEAGVVLVVNGTARPQGVIPLVDDRQEHYVEVDLS
jgi:hypothetical protein